MAIEIIECEHRRAFRDPAPCFDLYQSMILVGGLVYIPAALWGTLEGGGAAKWVFLVLLIILLAPWLRERLLDFLTSRNETLGNDFGGAKDVKVIGRPGQVRRLLHAARMPVLSPEVFRVGFQREVQFSLLFVCLVLLPGLFLLAEVSHLVISFAALTAYGMGLLQLCYARRRYRVEAGKLILEELHGLRVVCAHEVDLSKQSVTIDFARSWISVRSTEAIYDIRLDELLRPNRFAAVLMANMRE